jgi:hypothetical protein
LRVKGGNQAVAKSTFCIILEEVIIGIPTTSTMLYDIYYSMNE